MTDALTAGNVPLESEILAKSRSVATQQAETTRLALEPEEVGGSFWTFFQGLYSDARDAIREYAQNGVDAGASIIRVTVSGPRVVITDNGFGMDKETFRKSRRFGISDKNAAKHVGFRGIGVYSAFGMCESLTITTRQVGMEAQPRTADIQLEIYFRWYAM